MAEARAGLAVQLEAFAANTMEYLERERELLLDGVGVPDIHTELEGRHALVVVRGYDYRAGPRRAAALHPRVPAGADRRRRRRRRACVEAGYKPDIIIGDMDSVSDDALRCGAEVVVHAYPDGTRARAGAGAGARRRRRSSSRRRARARTSRCCSPTSKGASLIVAVGTHATLVEFLDKGRAGMATTFLTRLRVGGKLVDAKGVSRLYRSRIRIGTLLLLLLATVVAFAVAFAVTPGGQLYRELYSHRLASTSCTGCTDCSRDRFSLPRRLHRRRVPRARARPVRRQHVAAGRGACTRISTKADSVKRENDALTSQVHTLQGQVSADEKFDKALLPYAVSGRLSGQLVSIISAPGTSDSVRKQVIAAVDAAGGTLSADVRLQNAYHRPEAGRVPAARSPSA